MKPLKEPDPANPAMALRTNLKNPFMSQAQVSKIKAANSTLIIQNDLDAVGEFFAPDYVVHLTGQCMDLGHDGVRRILRMYRRAFGDLQIEVEVLVAAKDRVAWLRTFRATHKGDFKGFPATGRAIVWREMVTSRFRDGLIAEDWLITDLAERLLRARKR
jgi:steroid delta-isomerase-like uncharacterized protein